MDIVVFCMSAVLVVGIVFAVREYIVTKKIILEPEKKLFL